MKKDVIQGFARYSLNRSNQLHEQTCHGVHCASVALSGVLREQSPVEDFLFDVNYDGSKTFVSDYSVLSGSAAFQVDVYDS